jgi:ubiquinone/menaquinone biosynthesis C-methylase UbiE
LVVSKGWNAMSSTAQQMEQPPRIRRGLNKRIFAWVMSRESKEYERETEERKRRLLGNLRGTVVEIGPGTGPNLPYYPAGVRWIGIEPNPFMHKYLRQEAERHGLEVDLRTGTAEHIGLPDGSADAVVSTLVLCSVGDQARALREIVRILKPGGRYVFIEHVAAPQGTTMRRIQRAMRPVMRSLADGCHPDRETWKAIEQAGFSSVEIEHYNLNGSNFVAPHICGVAIK